MFDGILKTHGKMLAVIGGGLILVVVLVGEEDSPGVLSTVRDQAEAAGPGTLQKPSWLGSQAEPPPPVSCANATTASVTTPSRFRMVA